ncbi:MAG TPA: ABC transporter permease [Nitrospirota bacterium]|nr:ABC transporter permease [Nitrospirota bacterium]
MKLLDISLNNLFRKKGRTFFLVSGLAIGIGAAVAMTSVGEAMNREVMHALDEFGANMWCFRLRKACRFRTEASRSRR